MAYTFTYADVLNFIRQAVPSTTEDQKAAMLCNIATDFIWDAFDWRETIEEFPPFWLYAYGQDYGAPTVAVPSDFLGLREAWLTDMSSTPPAKWPMKIMRFLLPTHALQLPSDIAYEPSVNAFRLWPRVPSGLGPARFKIDGTYKKKPTLLTAGNYLSTTLPFDDKYFPVWVEVMKWAAWNSSSDPRSVDQLNKAVAAVRKMASDEGFNLGDTVLAPSQPLSAGSGIWGNRNWFLGY